MNNRKSAKEEYKQMKFPSGVFQIRNMKNGKIFVGSSTDLNTVWNSQKFKLNAGLHPNDMLQKDWKEYGEENFVCEVLDELVVSDEKPKDISKETKVMELMFIEELQPYGEKGYHKQMPENARIKRF